MGRRRKGKIRRSEEQMDGLLVLKKPSGPTSTNCLMDIKHQLKQFKIGHAGTLDPLAEGVLLVLLGEATKLATYLSGQEKEYTGELKLGISTDTYDILGEVVSEKPVEATPETITAEINGWNELTEQEVPAYSAAKHKGKPLYALARAGEEVPVKIKAIVISKAEALRVDPPEAAFRVRCSAGTYVRSLVHSLGIRLGCGATMTSLNRIASGSFTLEQAYSLEDVLSEPEKLPERIIPMGDILPWPKLALTTPLSELVMNGGMLPVGTDDGEPLPGQEGTRAMFLDPDGNPLALVEAQMKDDQLKWAILRGLWKKD